ncbi:MAG: DUF4363 family protein [Clostridia bacterium]|nr:DUF4363 family protein [Clostridia bacterium]
MKRILITSILIIIIVIASDFVIKKNIFKDFNYIISGLYTIDNQKNNEEKIEEINNLNSFIESKYLIMAFYIDHSELEKIKTQMVIIEAGVEESDDSFLHEEIKRTIFIVEHLKKKIDFKLENIL